MNERDSERPIAELDDEEDREELRRRYYGLMQELRVVLPGVQVLVAFLLTAPFAQRFADLDDLGKGLFGASLAFSVLSVVAFVTPTALHRFGDRRARAARLQTSVRMTRVGLICLALGMSLALLVVSRFLYATAVTVVLVATTFGAMLLFWIVAPIASRSGRNSD
jgi:hypothetical protein